MKIIVVCVVSGDETESCNTKSYDLMSYNYYLWEYVKYLVYADKTVNI